MKTIITTILLLTALISKSQINLDNLKIYSVSPDTVNVNDSITIKFRIYYTGGSNFGRIQLWTSTYLQDCFYKYAGFYTQDTAIYKVKITPNMGTGNARLYSNYTNPYKSFYIKSNDVSVNELSKYEIVSKQYYDIYGKEKPSIEGLTIVITTYSNGYQKREKIIIQ